MTHEECLNRLLDSCCGQLSDETLKKNGGKQEFYIELHCESFIVRAKYLGEGLGYEILACMDRGEYNEEGAKSA